MEEYILQTNSTKQWQMQLNQWRHDYTIEVLSMVHVTSHLDSITILIKRTPKPTNP